MGEPIVEIMPRRNKRTPESHPYSEIGGRLRFVREFLDLSQEEMARKSGVSLSTYNNWETGLGRIGIDSARMLRKQLQVSLDFIYEGDASALSAILQRAWLSRS